MAKFPTYEEMAKNIAEKALDEFLYDGKSIREWIQIIASEDYISRREVLDILKDKWNMFSDANDAMQESIDTIEVLPPVTPQLSSGLDKNSKELEKVFGESDCISRQAVLDLINADWKYEGLEIEINNLPPITPQPRKGHWKLVQRGKFVDVCCSNCEAVRIKEYAYNYTIDQLNKEDINECFGSAEMRYCPNCGSRNEVENDTD